jgi:hypothetical protein
MGGYTRAVSGQRLGKHVTAKQTTGQRPLLGSRYLIKQNLEYNNERAVFSTWSAQDVISNDKWSVDNPVRESVKKKPQPESEE